MTARRANLPVDKLDRCILASILSMPESSPKLTATSAPTYASRHALAGRGHGRYTHAQVQVHVGMDYNLNGSAFLKSMGWVNIQGDVHPTGSVQHGHTMGTLIFTNQHGSVTLEMEGPMQPAFAPPPQLFDYHVLQGTGAYEHLADHGTLHLNVKDLSAAHGIFNIVI